MEIKGSVQSWMRFLVTEKRQKVWVNDAVSPWRTVESGVSLKGQCWVLPYLPFFKWCFQCDRQDSTASMPPDDTKIYATENLEKALLLS